MWGGGVRRGALGESRRKTAGSNVRATTANDGSQFENNYFTELCSGSEAGSYSRRIDVVYHSTLGLRVIKNKKSLKCNFDSPFGASTPLLEL